MEDICKAQLTVPVAAGRDDTQGVEATAAGDKHPDEGWTPFEVCTAKQACMVQPLDTQRSAPLL